ncbi:MAG: hypothetical protein NTX49_06825 [Chlamydiae bacterium]|nr:hypothetical protein [Chlamydiota bacterium]
MSFSVISKKGGSLIPVEAVQKNTAPSTKDPMSFLREIPPFKGAATSMLHGASSDSSSSLVALTDRFISVSPSRHRDSAVEFSSCPVPRSPSPVLLQYIAEEDRLDGSSSEHEELHALNYSRQVSADLAEGRVIAALVKVSIISIPSVRIAVECEIFEQVLRLSESYPKDSAKFKEYEDIAWSSLNRAFDFLKKAKPVLTPAAYSELEGMLIRCAGHS